MCLVDKAVTVRDIIILQEDRCSMDIVNIHVYFFSWLRRHEYPTGRCCESRSGEEPGRVFRNLRALSAHPSRLGQQHECLAPEQLDYAVREWVCSTGTYRHATADAGESKEENQRTASALKEEER